MTTAADSLRVEVDFGGTWVDVSQWFKAEAGGSTRFGRTSEYSQVQSGTLGLTLDNRDGRFTPLSQVYWPNGRDQAAQPHPYWPNVTPRRPIRFGYVVGGIYYPRFTGLVQGWPPSFGDADNPIVQITASDYLSILGGMDLKAAVTSEVLADAPMAFWPLTDAAGSIHASQVAGGTWPALSVTGSGTALVFGDDGPDGIEGSGVAFASTNGSEGQYLWGALLDAVALSGFTGEAWVKSPAALSREQCIFMLTGSTIHGGFQLTVTIDAGDGTVFVDAVDPVSESGTTPGAGPSVADGSWHHVAFTYSPTGHIALYVDGVEVSSGAFTTAWQPQFLYAGQTSDHFFHLVGNLGPIALYDTTLTAARIAQHYQAGRAFNGETVDQRIGRFLDYVGIPGGTPYGSGLYGAGTYGGGVGIDLDPSTVTLSGYAQSGKDVLSACQDAVASEGGGAVLYVTTDGTIRFEGRDYRNPTTPTLTIEAGADDGSGYQPAYDDRTIVNTVDAVRATLATSATVETVTIPDSIDAYGTSGDSVTSYALDPADVVHLAEERAATHAEPGFRLQQITVDPLTSQNPQWAATAATGIGDRIRVTSLPPTAAPRSIIDSLAEGWADTFNAESYTITFDTSPADNPARFIWDDTTYGRWGGDSNTLHAGITAAATSLAVDTPAGLPLFTTDPADYPLDIRIDEEEMTVTTAPGATSPQTMTVTRGVNGTTAAAHATGATVDVAVAATWTL